MAFANLGQTEQDITFEHGFYKGLLIAETRHEFLKNTCIDKDGKLSKQKQKEYDKLFNQPHKRRTL